MEHEYKLTISVKGKNRHAKKNNRNQKQKLKKEVESLLGKNTAGSRTVTGEGKSFDIFYTPSILNSDDHSKFSGSREDMLKYLRENVSIKFIVDYDDINLDNFDMVSADRITKSEEIHALEDKLKNLEANLTVIERKNEQLRLSLENNPIEPGSESIKLEPDSKPYSTDPVGLLNSINEETKKKFVEDHSDYSEHAEELGMDGVLEYIVKLVESSNYLNINKTKFTASIIGEADNGKIFDDIEVLEDIVMYYTLEKLENKLDLIPESIQKIETTLAKDTQDDPQDVTNARAFVEMYELWDEGSILKEQSKLVYDSSLRTIKKHDSKKSLGDKDLARMKGTVKLMDHYSEELNKSETKWSDIERLMQERDERSENGDEFLYFGLRTEDKSEVSMPIEPIPAEVAESMGYFIERIHILPSERIRE
tara:strand:- start:199 stop:1467 length:1269 start_codon:yes stop_codon:yes gene_type:complete